MCTEYAAKERNLSPQCQGNFGLSPLITAILSPSMLFHHSIVGEFQMTPLRPSFFFFLFLFFCELLDVMTSLQPRFMSLIFRNILFTQPFLQCNQACTFLSRAYYYKGFFYVYEKCSVVFYISYIACWQLWYLAEKS